MKAMRWFRSGATPRGTPASRRPSLRHPVIPLVLALAALSQAGCQSGPFGPCGSCGGLGDRMRSLSERAFRPFHGGGAAASSGCCGSEIGAPAAALPYGTPGVIAPAAPGGTVLPAPADSLPSNLDPIPPSAGPGPPPSGSGGEAAPSQGAKSPNGRTNYDALRPRSNGSQARADGLSRTLTVSPEPTPRSAQGSARSNAADTMSLDNLPPLELPHEPRAVTQADRTPPAAGREAPPPAATGPAPPAAAADPEAPAEMTVAPGIRRFSGVETKLAGGSLPNATGLDWLVEKGYKTVLDLREDADLSPSFLSDVTRRGLRYVALPITAKTVDADHVSRFDFEISLAGARPLYFCDTDGTRAGAMWYVHRVAVDKVDPLVARRDAEELGMTDSRFWLAAQSYLDGLKPAPDGAPAPVPAAAPAASPPEPASGKPSARSEAPAAAATDGSNAPPPPTAGPPPGPPSGLSNADGPAPEAPRDPTAWRPIAALLVTGLGVPLAYLSRSAVPTGFRALARASLPGPRRSARSLPHGSDG